MAFVRPTLTELVDRVLSDLATRLSLSGVPLRRSVVGILARVEAGAAHLLHGHLEFLGQQLFPDRSIVEFLERQASTFGITRTAATYATGSVTFTGTNGTLIPAGTLVQRADAVEYATDANVTISGGTATAAVTANEPGVGGNAEAAVALTCVAPIAGVNAGLVVAVGGVTGGADVEADDSLRARLLTRLQQPPHGGSGFDYVTWAKEVTGVTRAWVYAQENGPGTVVVRFVRDGDGSGAAIIPDSGEIATVQAYIDERRPVTANVSVYAPVSVPRNFTIHIVPDTTDTRAAVQQELADYLERAAEPAGTLLISQIRVAVGAAAGVTDFSVPTPAADVTHTLGQIATMGTITWT